MRLPIRREGKPLEPWYGAKYDFEYLFTTRSVEDEIWNYLQRLERKEILEEIARKEHHIPKGQAISVACRIVPNFISQAREYFNAGRTSNILTSPDMYYYSFLNLAKAYVALKQARTIIKLMSQKKLLHGMSVGAVDYSKALYPTTQKVSVHNQGNGVFRLFAECLGLQGYEDSFNIIDLCSLCPDLQDNFWRTTKRWPLITQVAELLIYRSEARKELWVLLQFDHDAILDVFGTLKDFSDAFSGFRRVAGPSKDHVYLESINTVKYSKGFKSKIESVRTNLLKRNFYAIQSGPGSFYHIPCTGTVLDDWHFAMVLLAGMCYFSNMSRYHPLTYEKLIGGKYGWLFKDFIQTSPTRFMHSLVNEFYHREFQIVRSYP